MGLYENVFKNNKDWVEHKKKEDPQYFVKSSQGQSPEILYIGCSDSRIPIEQIIGAEPGEVFVHRNIANMVNNADISVQSVIQFAVQQLEVKHIVVCGHYGCGGLKAASLHKDYGSINMWLNSIHDVYRLHKEELDAISDETEKLNRFAELNVVEQCINVAKSSFVQNSYKETGYPKIHGWVKEMDSGLVKDLEVNLRQSMKDVLSVYKLD